MKRIVIAGLGSAGYAALAAAHQTDPRSEILIIDPKDKDIFHPCGMPYALGKRADADKLCADIRLSGIGATRIRAKLVSIIPEKKIAITDDSNDSNAKISFDKLIIATGAVPFVPPIDLIEKFIGRGLYTFASPADLAAVKDALTGKPNVIVIGGGAIGVEAAAELAIIGCGVTLIEAQNSLLPGVLDADMAEIVSAALKELNIDVVCGINVEQITGDQRFTGIKTERKTFEAGIGILAAGFAAKADAAYAAFLDGSRNSISVNSQMQTSIQNIYAAGDCVLCCSVIDGKPFAAKSAAAAYRQGKIAGINAAGGRAVYNGSSGTFAGKAGELEIAAVGFTSNESRKRGFEPASGKIKMRVLPDYFACDDTIAVKITADKRTKRILGAQAVGKNAASEINLISMAIEQGLALPQLIEVETAYCPALNELDSPLFKAADFCLRKINT